MSKFKKNIEISNVDRIHRPGIGYVYKGIISLGDLAHGLADGNLKYAPKYQRGAVNDFDDATLVHVTDESILIDVTRASQMAAKYLMGFDRSHKNPDDAVEFFNPDVIWNARKSSHPAHEVEYQDRKLIVHTTITIPDSAHRHYVAYLLLLWHEDSASIPEQVEISSDGRTVDAKTLKRLMTGWDPFDEENSSVFVTIFNVTAEYEGRLFDEYNVEGKKPTAGAAIDMNPTSTASRRFTKALTEKCAIFDRLEIEIRKSTIPKKSRKITTLATLESAIKPYQRELLKIQAEKKLYEDLLDFFTAFYTEWASLYTELQPDASTESRIKLRDSTFVLSNIMFFPMFRLAFELWQKYTKAGTTWKSSKEWRDGLAKLAGGEVDAVDAHGNTIKVHVMARDHNDEDGSYIPGNPDWRGKILVQKFDKDGAAAGWGLSSTRQTRDAAYYYLLFKTGLDLGKTK